tara:strand:- start:53 stop:712 length:660 start_codon:yes stop_codon:yes gene_type:complete
MSTITETMKDEALYVPGEHTANGTTAEREYTPKTAGRYLGHIIDLEITDEKLFDERDLKTRQLTGRKLKARFFNLRVRVAPETAELTFTHHGDDGTETTHTGADYVGWEVKGGIPRYLEPQDGDTFDANPGGNEDYLELCRVVGVHPETREINNNGTTVTAHVLPVLKREDAINRPVTAIVGRGKDWTNTEGRTVRTYKVKKVNAWTDGKRLATDDLPF